MERKKKGKSDWTVQAPDGCSHPSKGTLVVPTVPMVWYPIPAAAPLLIRFVLPTSISRVRTKLVRSRLPRLQ